VLDIKSNQSSVGAAPAGQNEEVPRPRPQLELPPIEPESNYLTTFSIIATILVVAAGVGLYVLKSTKTSAYNTKQAEVSELTGQLGASPLKELDKQITSLQKGLALYQNALSGQILWSMMFKDFEKTAPKNIKLTALAMDEKQAVKLSGEGSDFSSVAKLVRSLENSKDFSDVKLVSATASDPEKGGAINFAVTLTVKSANLRASAQASTITPVGETPSGTTAAPAAENSNQLPGTTNSTPSQP